MVRQYSIIVKIILHGQESTIHTFRNEYRSLMNLIQDKLYVDDFGECGGMGRCATCQVKLSNAPPTIGLDRNESSTLSGLGITDPSIRLSCQIPVDDPLHNCIVTILA
ncbi:MAG: 2Fe-2S iron-sulfur cluster binding domain-containing protein [Bacteroidetes bacterium]|nr:2Fe-2S iron-sulfur cluster binding domain-containing protein [Bacteroidota bacterium]